MPFITDRMLYGDIKVASQVIRESVGLAASEAAKDHPHAMPWAAQIAVRTHTAVISSLRKTLHRKQIGDPDMRLSHQHIIAAVCDAANAAGKAVTQASHPDLSSAWQRLSPQDRGAAAGQMANLSVITALDTARRLFIEANHRPQAAAPGPRSSSRPPKWRCTSQPSTATRSAPPWTTSPHRDSQKARPPCPHNQPPIKFLQKAGFHQPRETARAPWAELGAGRTGAHCAENHSHRPSPRPSSSQWRKNQADPGNFPATVSYLRPTRHINPGT